VSRSQPGQSATHKKWHGNCKTLNLANLIAYVKCGVHHKEMQGIHLGAIKGEQEVKPYYFSPALKGRLLKKKERVYTSHSERERERWGTIYD
jgi:hypothetical protein